MRNLRFRLHISCHKVSLSQHACSWKQASSMVVTLSTAPQNKPSKSWPERRKDQLRKWAMKAGRTKRHHEWIPPDNCRWVVHPVILPHPLRVGDREGQEGYIFLISDPCPPPLAFRLLSAERNLLISTLRAPELESLIPPWRSYIHNSPWCDLSFHSPCVQQLLFSGTLCTTEHRGKFKFFFFSLQARIAKGNPG